MRANQDSEAMADAYGRNLGTKYGAEDAPAIVTRSLHSTEIAVTEICVHRPLGWLSDPIPRVDAYMICLMLRDIPNNVYWEEGRHMRRSNENRTTSYGSHSRCACGLLASTTEIHSLKSRKVRDSGLDRRELRAKNIFVKKSHSLYSRRTIEFVLMVRANAEWLSSDRGRRKDE
jgi:hypothetical protein